MNQVYVIDSVYHIYVSILLSHKNYLEGKKTLLVINQEGTKGIEQYVLSLKKLKSFEDVISVKASSAARAMRRDSNKFDSIFRRPSTLVKQFEAYNPHIKKYHNFIENSEINLFHIIMSKAYFLLKHPENYFRMIEEGIGTYTKKPKRVRRFKRRLMGLPQLMGYDKQVKEILVQEPKKMVDSILRSKSKKLNLIQLLGNLTDDDKRDVVNCFGIGSLDIYSNKKKAVILTQPLIKSGFEVTPKQMISIYKKMIDGAKSRGMEVYLKLHPREEIDYEEVFKEEGVKIISKILPIEILNMDNSIYFDEAHTICSGAIDNLAHVGYRNNLGVDYLKKRK